jgi:XisH protein
MPAQDIYHDAVVRALTADGWMITHDPLSLSYGGRDLYVDLGAERTTIAAERDGQKIAVEIKSFLGSSPIRDLEEAVGQYEVYRSVSHGDRAGSDAVSRSTTARLRELIRRTIWAVNPPASAATAHGF